MKYKKIVKSETKRFYKVLSRCLMCKIRFELVRDKGKLRSSSYCPACVKKYFGKK